MQNKLYRVVDVNLNRAREALRVCEDVTRFVLGDKKLTEGLKAVRHNISKLADNLFENAIRFRDVKGDIGKRGFFDKSQPESFKSLFYKNAHRAEESTRALEEFSKLINPGLSKNFKALRFNVYAIEKKAVKKLQALCNN